ncbi:MAG: histone deacetylase family protein [Tepidisphaeraceae bacterium]
MTGFCTSPRFVDHATGAHHPERPDRVRAIATAARQAGLIDSPTPFSDFEIDFGLRRLDAPNLVELDPAPVDEAALRFVHDARHVERVRRVCETGGGVLDQGDTRVGPESYDVARLAAGGVVRCCDAVMNGLVRRAFAAGRPPGHHAEPDRAMGFCLFNNIAIAARRLQRVHGIGRVAIVDFDVHHGNGTQAVFENDPSVLFISLHQDPRTLWPRTGFALETGTGAGEGYTLNIPFEPGAGDEEYARAFESHVIPRLEAFRPEFLLISAGFDAHHDDPLADMRLTEDAFEWMTRELVGVADRHCAGRVVSSLEGGYDLRALGRCAVRHLVALDGPADLRTQ